jgi:polysaccharide pyruvyl transferase WcaK-like protein
MNHIFYQTKTKYTNTGDVLINAALIDVLRDYGQVCANCSTEIPETFLTELGIRDSERVYVKNELAFYGTILRYARKAKKQGDRVYLFSGPGEMVGGSLSAALRNMVVGFALPVLRLAGVNIVRVGRSVGPLTRLMAISEWFRCLWLTHYFVRDTQSLERCRKMGIKKVKLSPDLSWLYDPEHPRRVNNTGVVMVNLRHSIYDHDVQDGFIEATLRRCKEILCVLNRLMGGQMKVCVAYQTKPDQEFAERFYSEIKDSFQAYLVDHQLRLDELEQYYGTVDYHISNRMHGLLAGYKYGSVPIALVDTREHIKVAVTFRDCGLDELLFDIYEENDDTRLSALHTRRTEVLDGIWQCEAARRSEIIHTFDNVFGKV